MLEATGRTILGLGFGLLCLAAAGCSGTVQTRVTSQPSGAKVYLDGTYVGTTPFTLPLEDSLWKREFYTLTAELEGYGSDARQINEPFDRVIAGAWIPKLVDFNLLPPGAPRETEAPAAAPPEDPRIAQMRRLRDSGVLSDQEFEAEKARIEAGN